MVLALDIVPEITIGITGYVTGVLLEEGRNQILDLMFKMLGPLPLQPGLNIPQALQFLLDPSYGPNRGWMIKVNTEPEFGVTFHFF